MDGCLQRAATATATEDKVGQSGREDPAYMTYPYSREPTLVQHGKLEDESLTLELSLSLPVLCVASLRGGLSLV